VSPDGGGFQGGTDQALAAFGMQRTMALPVPRLLQRVM